MLSLINSRLAALLLLLPHHHHHPPRAKGALRENLEFLPRNFSFLLAKKEKSSSFSFAKVFLFLQRTHDLLPVHASPSQEP